MSYIHCGVFGVSKIQIQRQITTSMTDKGLKI